MGCLEVLYLLWQSIGEINIIYEVYLEISAVTIMALHQQVTSLFKKYL